MKGLYVACPECKKPLITEGALPNGTVFKLICGYCRVRVKLMAEPGKLRVIIIRKISTAVPLTDDDDSDIIMLNV